MAFFENSDEPICGKCKLYETCETDFLPIIGGGKKKILIVMEAPTATEDKAGERIPHNMLDSLFREFEIDMKKDCWLASAVQCHPPKGRKPKSGEVVECSHRLRKFIAKVKPEKIITFGKIATEVIVQHKIKVNLMSAWAGAAIPDQEYNAMIFPCFSPGYIQAVAREESFLDPFYKAFVGQIKQAAEWDQEIGKQISFSGYSKDPAELKTIVRGVWAIDFETTGLKPHAKGHKIVCISFSNGKKNYCFENTPEILPEIKRIFTSKEIKLIAHNLKFEDAWSRESLGIQITNWFWDTMVAAHCIDNRRGILRLKLQTYFKFGIGGYEKEVQKYLEAGEKNANAINHIDNAPQDKLFEYCAQDSFYCVHLYRTQKRAVPPGYFLFLEGLKELSLIESTGFRMDVGRIEKHQYRLTERIKKLKEKMYLDPDIVKWQLARIREVVEKIKPNKRTGEKRKPKPEEWILNPNSPSQLRSFFHAAGETFWKITDKGNDSTDKDVLFSFKHPVAKQILEIRRMDKLCGTFLHGLAEESVDGILHPFFSLAIPITFRSSSSNPNAQNWPKRDPRAEKIIRGNFIPREGNQFLEVDYKGVEVVIAATYNQDPNLIAYIKNPETDMHRDVAAQIFKIKKEDVTKEIRQFAKGGFVFPAFYGSWYKQMAESMWRDMTLEMKKLIKGNGLKTAFQFEKHIQKIEDHFWKVRFKVYAAWKKRKWSEYLRQGYVESKTGFIYTSIMDRKEVSNYPIQGSAFHCLLWSLIQMNRWLRKNKMKSLIVGQIHDSLILDVVPKELPEVKKQLREITCNQLREHWEWINIPMGVDADISKVDGSWAEMETTEI